MSQLMPGNALGFLLTDASRIYRQAFEKAVESSGLGLTPGEIRALAHVARYDGSRQAVLAEHMGVEPMTLSAYIDRLEVHGLVTRMPDPTDRRAKVIRTSAKVEKLFADVRPLAFGVYSRAIKGLSESEVQILETALATIRFNLALEPDINVARRPSNDQGKGAAA